jgi:gliding motility-associated-like protein
MKKLFFALIFLFSILSNAQFITVNTNNTPTQLVNNVLLNGACNGGVNPIVRSGNNFGSTNGIASFTNTNPNFPMSSGVILTTGNVANAPGPNSTLLDEGSLSWTGDAQLEAQLGITGTTNASVLEFDFTPVSSNFSFDFIFASEEYGTFQCQGFYDSFAFLLTNSVTGVTTNLAVIPGTTIPISVNQIRNGVYNNFVCPSVNDNFFGNFYGGSNSSVSPTNFNGQTVLMNASATLTPGVSYHIKLVIADGTDFKADSAVFISGNSFNIGQDVLPADLTVANNTAICFGQNYTIQTGLSALDYSFSWSKDGGTPIVGSNSFLVSAPGNYQVSYTKIGSPCPPEINNIIIEYLPQIVTINPKNIFKCDTGAASYSYDIAQNTSYLLAGLPVLPVATTTIDYFSDFLATIPINSPYLSPPNTTIYVKITNTLNGCSLIKPFDLLVIPFPTATIPTNTSFCENSNGSNNATIALNGFNNEVLGPTQVASGAFSVTYYGTQSAANAGASGTQLSGTSFLATNNTTIYVRVTNISDTTCFATTFFTIITTQKPTITDIVKDVFVCTQYILPSVSAGVRYFTGNNGGGVELFAGNVITTPAYTNPVTIFLYSNINGCDVQKSFAVTFIDLTLIPKPILDNCDGFTIPSLVYASFYSTSQLGSTSAGTPIAPGTVLSTSQTIYMYFKSIDEANCEQEIPFPIKITPSPVITNTFVNIFKCVGETYSLPPLTPIANSTVNYYNGPDGTLGIIADGTIINTTKTIYIYASSGTKPCTDKDQFEIVIGLPTFADENQCTSFSLPALVVGNYYSNSGGPGTVGSPNAQTPILSNTVIDISKNIFVYAVSSSGCVQEVPYKINITLPIINPALATPIVNCEQYILPALPAIPNNTNVTPNQTYQQLFYNTKADGTGTTYTNGQIINASQTVYVVVRDGICVRNLPLVIKINPLPIILLTDKLIECNSYTLVNDPNVNFYYGPNQTLGQVPIGTVFSADNVIYAYAVNSTTNCFKEIKINIQIDIIKAKEFANITQCISYTLPTITQSTSDDDNKYYSAPGGLAANLITAGTVISTTQTIYVFNKKNNRRQCSDEKSFTITIDPNPIVLQPANVIACDKYILPPITVGNYFSETGGTGTQYFSGNEISASQTMYVFAGNSNQVGCTTSQKIFNITINKVDKLADVSRCYGYTLPALTSGNYFTGPNGTGTPRAAGFNVLTNQLIYIYKKFPTGLLTFCESQTSFNVTIIPIPVINSVSIANRTFCDTDGDNDGKILTDLTQYNTTILGTQTGSQFSVAYYETQFDANLNNNPIVGATLLQNVFVRVNNNTLNPSCYDVKPFDIIVNKLPEPTNPEKLVICISNSTGEILNSVKVDSGLSANNYTFVWTDSTNATISTSSNLPSIIVAGTFSVVATNKLTGCVSEKVTTNVILSQIAIASFALSENFSDDQFVTITAEGAGGIYEYQLDDNLYQDSNIFTSVPYGNHEITVRDKNGCGTTIVPILVINYPKYFTPNGDAINENWNVIGLENELNSKVSIFDRSGKLINQIKTTDIGWDGRYNGELLPATDYWFVVNYIENGIEKVFKSHFTLKR